MFFQGKWVFFTDQNMDVCCCKRPVSPMTVAGQAGLPQQRLHDWRGSWPWLHPEQKDQERTVGTVQLHPWSVLTASHSPLYLHRLFPSCPSGILISSLLFARQSGGREGEDEQHGERAHPRQQGSRRALGGGVHPASDAAQEQQKQKRRGGVLKVLRATPLFSPAPPAWAWGKRQLLLCLYFIWCLLFLFQSIWSSLCRETKLMASVFLVCGSHYFCQGIHELQFW